MAKRPPQRSRATQARSSRWDLVVQYRVLAVFVVAGALRLAYVLSIRDAYFFHHPQTESLHYDEWARAILAGTAPAPPFEQAPGYPYFLAAIAAVFGPGPTAIALCQSLLDALSCVLIARIAHCWFGPRAGLAAGLLSAAYGPLIYFAGERLPATLFVFLIVAAIAVAAATAPTRAAAPRARRRAARPAMPTYTWIVAGALWGAALWVRSEALLAFPVVLVDAWQRGKAAAALGTAAVLALSLATVLAVNSGGGSRFVPLTTSGGVNLWLGNNPNADGVNPFFYGPLIATDQIVRKHARDASEADHLYRERAVQFWREQPAAAAWLLWKKFLWTWTDRELPNTSDIDWQAAHSWLFRARAFPLRLGVVLPLACVGAVFLGRRWLSHLLLVAPLLIGVGTCLLFFTNARFRLVMIPSLLILAASALVQLPQLAGGRPRRIVAAVLAAVVGLYAAWGNPYGIQAYRVPQIVVNTGILEREAGRFDSAVRYLREGVHGEPRDSLGWIHLALALEQNGQPDEALQAYFSALAMADDADARKMSARFFTRQRLDPALLEAYVAAPNPTVQADVAAQTLRQLRGEQPRPGP